MLRYIPTGFTILLLSAGLSLAAPPTAESTAKPVGDLTIEIGQGADLTKGQCTQLGGDVLPASKTCKSGKVCARQDRTGAWRYVCISSVMAR